MKKNIGEMMKKAREVKPSSQGNGQNSKVSFSIVNSANNGKRIMFSKGLLEKLGNPTTVKFMVLTEEGVLIVGENLGAEKAYKFSEANKKIIYCGGVINSLVEDFSIDFEGRTSRSFAEIDIGSYNDNPVAIIKLKK